MEYRKKSRFPELTKLLILNMKVTNTIMKIMKYWNSIVLISFSTENAISSSTGMLICSFYAEQYGNFEKQKLKVVYFQNSVTLCAYPFILNAQAKTTMLQTDAELQMQVTDSTKLSFCFCCLLVTVPRCDSAWWLTDTFYCFLSLRWPWAVPTCTTCSCC